MSRRRISLRIGLVAALAGACAGPHPPAASGGEPLAGTADAVCPADTGFFLSPDGRRLVFETGDPSDPRYVAFGEPSWAVYDTGGGERREVEVDPAVVAAAVEGEGPLAAGACWDGGGRLYLPGPARGAWFVLAAASDRPGLAPSGPPDCAPDDGTGPPAPPAPPAETRVEVRHPAPDRAEIAALGGGILAAHDTDDLAATRLAVRHLRLSPDGRFLSYLLTDMQGSFTTPSRAYVLDLDAAPAAGPHLLAAPVSGPPVWGPDDELYACLGGRRSELSEGRIVRWRPRTFKP